MNIDHCSLNEVEEHYRQGRISYEEARNYIRKWNAGPHFTQAVLVDGRIKNDEPAKLALFYRSLSKKLFAEFGVRE